MFGTKMSVKVAGMFIQNFTRIGTQLITPEKVMWRRGGEEGRRGGGEEVEEEK